MRTSYIFAAMLLVAVSCKTRPAVEADYKVVPLPADIELTGDGAFRLSPATCLVAADSAQAVNADLFAGYIETLTGFRPEIKAEAPSENFIRLVAVNTATGAEGYVLTVTADSIRVDGADAAGTFYGLQTLRKAIRGTKGDDVLYPAAVITDAPRFAYRGGHFDCSRHFFPVDSVKTYIDMLALHNINRFHWHLTDDQGWRVEIKSRPRLTEIGSHYEGPMYSGNYGDCDTISTSGFYTQEQMRDVVEYAAERHITIIPEIDIPGHMRAALLSYPELHCPDEWWNVLCAGSDSIYSFIDDVLVELTAIFPSEYIHIGGDEVSCYYWKHCPKCQAKIRALGLKDDAKSTAEQKLQNHIMKYASERLASHGRRVIGWDEIIDNGLDTTAVVMSWRGPDDGGQDGSKLGYQVIKSPNTHLYFDYPYAEGDSVGARFERKIPLAKVYEYEPVDSTMTPEQAAQVLGVQANLWTEAIPTLRDAQYMALPRMAALADIQWSNEPKDYDGFLKRLQKLLKTYEAEGYNYRQLKR